MLLLLLLLLLELQCDMQLAYLATCETAEDAARKWNEAARFKGQDPGSSALTNP
jgi:hypothetical protein